MLQICSTVEQSCSQYFKPRIITESTRIKSIVEEKQNTRIVGLNTLF